MKQIIINNKIDSMEYIDRIKFRKPIFAMRNEKWAGMIVQESEGWILRIGGCKGCSGFYSDIYKCLERASDFDYTFWVEYS